MGSFSEWFATSVVGKPPSAESLRLMEEDRLRDRASYGTMLSGPGRGKRSFLDHVRQWDQSVALAPARMNEKECFAYMLGRRDARLGRTSLVPRDLMPHADAQAMVGLMASFWLAGHTDEIAERADGRPRQPEALLKQHPDWREQLDQAMTVTPASKFVTF